MGKKVYVVTRRSYSEYEIKAIFSTEERAKDYINAVCQNSRHSEYDIEDWDVDEYINGKQRYYEVWINYDNSEIERVDEIEFTRYSNPDNSVEIHDLGIFGRFVSLVFSTSRIDAVKKIASERLMQIKALQGTKYPYLFSKVVLGAIRDWASFHPELGERRNEHYPVYDFNTGHIWLEDGQDLKTGIKATTEIIKI